MQILTLNEAVELGFKPHEYEPELNAEGRVLRLDFRCKGRNEWIDCYFSCAKEGNDKFKLAAFKNDKNDKYTPKNSNINFGDDNLRGSIFVVTSSVEFGISTWSKAIKVL